MRIKEINYTLIFFVLFILFIIIKFNDGILVSLGGLLGLGLSYIQRKNILKGDKNA